MVNEKDLILRCISTIIHLGEDEEYLYLGGFAPGVIWFRFAYPRGGKGGAEVQRMIASKEPVQVAIYKRGHASPECVIGDDRKETP